MPKAVFVHPDLGIGGAEQLVINAALALQDRGWDVHFYTAHWDPSHCFGALKPGGALAGRVHVHGDFLPRHFFGRFMALFAYFRMIYTALVLLLLSLVGSEPGVDLVVSDQISVANPVLLGLNVPVLFYCHFPDKLLSTDRRSLLKRAYRAPLDYLEEVTTGAATKVLVNSKFTSSIFREAFPRLGDVELGVLYPAVKWDGDQAEQSNGVGEEEQKRKRKGKKKTKTKERGKSPGRRRGAKAIADFDVRPEIAAIPDDRVVLLSINRFERKKNIGLAIEALAYLRSDDGVKALRCGHQSQSCLNLQQLGHPQYQNPWRGRCG